MEQRECERIGDIHVHMSKCGEMIGGENETEQFGQVGKQETARVEHERNCGSLKMEVIQIRYDETVGA